MPTFDILVVGSGGGPDESNLSAYLLKPSGVDWQDGVVGLEAGSGLGTLHRILQQNPSLLRNATYTASEMYSFIKCFLISHAHFDHISGLILSAGSLCGGRKCVYATKETLDDIASVFNDRLWPNLASFDERDKECKLYLRPLGHNRHFTKIHPSISVLSLPLSHGASSQSPHLQIPSTAFFLRHDPTQREFLFFGDVEPDALASDPLNLTVWRTAAPKIPHTLCAIFIECSWTSERSDDTLYGHLNPFHLVNELLVLATEVWRVRMSQDRSRPQKRLKVTASNISYSSPTSEELRGVLDGLSIYIIHCKSDLTFNKPVRRIIEGQVQNLMEERGLGAKVFVVEQGTLIHI
ncbi:hypothetical protein AX15_005060 [Amanita polypyramis BW_CC]|nr:hypothetical protein AX15_005060 [Amanita polypyramis BW_CC]